MTNDPHAALALRTAALMSLGGDDRITVDELSGLNSYGCAPEPVRSISYASSTASSISSAAYAHVHAVHHQLRAAIAHEAPEAVYARRLRDARARIRTCYGLNADIDIAFGASGTDLEYLPIAAALMTGAPVRNIVIQVDEVGSGCQFSQGGRYFAPRTALGVEVEKGAEVPGFDEARIHVATVPTRREDGAALHEVLQSAIDAGERPILHVVHRSKTGVISPSLPVLDAALARFGDAFDLVVDACQGRIAPATVRTYVQRGAMVFVTGSKFIGGPPFSAFAIVPAGLSGRMRSGEAPAGLGNFFARAELPAGWKSTDAIAPAVANFGMLLRLEAALFELERLLAIPVDRLEMAISVFSGIMHNLPPDLPFRTADTAAASDLRTGRPHPLDRKMLHVIEITAGNPKTGKRLTFEEARSLYRLLYTALSDHFDDVAEQIVAAEICHLGQPVRCLRGDDGDWAPTLRMSLSAPQVADFLGLDEGRLEARFQADIARIGEKMRLALRLL